MADTGRVEMAEPAISTYGATGYSMSRPSFDLDEDDECYYLPMPEVDEEFLDEDVAATANGRRECMLYLS